jgi:hypothetical protein
MKYILSVLLALVSIQSYGAIIFRGDFESGTIVKPAANKPDSFWQNVMGPGCTLTNDANARGTYNAANDIHLVTSPKRAGDYAVSILTRRLCDYRTINGEGEQKGRQEILVQEQSFKQYLNTEYWVGFSFYIPTSYNIETNDQAITSIFQQKQLASDNPTGFSTTCCQYDFSIEGDQIHFEIENMYTTGSTVNSRTLQSEAARSYDWTLTKGVWTDVQLHYRMCSIELLATGCQPLYELWVNVNGAQSATPVKTWTSGANTAAGKKDGVVGPVYLAGPKASVYKYAYNCTIAGPNYSGYPPNSAQKDFAFCTTQINGNSRNPTNNLTSVNVFFDEILIGDASSSLAEIAPHVFDTPPPPPPVSVIGMNLGEDVSPNTPATINDRPITFTTNGGDTSGVSRITVTANGVTEDMPAIASNATGGHFYTGPFTGITDPNATFTFYYDNTMQLNTEGAQPFSGWDNDGVVSPVASYNLDGFLDFGATAGVTIANNEIGFNQLEYGDGVTKINVTSGDTIKIRGVLDAGTTGKARLRAKSRVGGVSLYNIVSGTLGSLSATTPTHGTNHVFTEVTRNGLHFFEWAYAASQTGIFEFSIGPDGEAIGDSVVALEAKVWVNQQYATPLTFNRTLALTDVTPPDIYNCTFGSPSSGNLQYTCNLSEIGGSVKLMVTSSATVPSKADIAACTGALACRTLPATELVVSGTETGINPYVDKHLYAYQIDGAGLESAVKPADDYVPAEDTVIKRIKFLSNTARLRTITGAEYTGPLDFFLLTNSDPRLPGTKNDLVYIDNPSISNGVINFTETNVQCATCTGSINALAPGEYWYSTRSEDGSVKSVYTINVVAE